MNANCSSSTPTPSASVRGAIASRKRSATVSGASGAWCLVVTSVPPLPCADAGLVALGVGEHPECGRRVLGEQPAAGCDRGVDPGLRRVVRNVDVHVYAIALRPGRIHLLEPDHRA